MVQASIGQNYVPVQKIRKVTPVGPQIAPRMSESATVTVA